LDSKRLTSFLAQLNDDGVLLSIKNTHNAEDEKKSLLSAGVNMGTRASKEENKTSSRQSEKHYDSTTTVLYEVMDRLNELGFIRKNISETPIGQLLLCSGTIRFQDIRMMRNLWEPIMKFVASGEQGNHKQKQEKTKEMDFYKSILVALPHALLMTFISNNKFLWSSLEEEHLKINSDDITLKHGANFAGEWIVLGILDAKPDEFSTQTMPTVGNPFFDGMTTILENIREFLGRPSSHYGITPIAIFRTVSAT
jgi:hypothetical protein